MKKIQILALALIIVGSALCQAVDAPSGPGTPPNIVFIYADDWGWGDLSSHSHPWLKTPNIDRLAAGGIDFLQFNVLNPVCSPSRAAALTGMCPARFSIHEHFDKPLSNAKRGMPDWLDPEAPLLSRFLKNAGYRTGHFGKWHLTNAGCQGAPAVTAYGFDQAGVFNGQHHRTGTLWEQRFKSVIVESGVAARTIAAYIDLNPVRAGMVSDPADYRWCGYSEAVGGGKKGNGKKAREGLVRACMSHKGIGFEAENWKEVSRIYRRAMGLALGRKNSKFKIQNSSKSRSSVTMNEEEMLACDENETILPDLGMAGMLRCRVRYFTDGAVIGSKAFVNEAFAGARERFTGKRKDGARRMRGSGAPAAGTLWSIRDLRVEV